MPGSPYLPQRQRDMAMKPGRSSKPEAMIGLDDCGGSKNSPEGAESWWIERVDMV